MFDFTKVQGKINKSIIPAVPIPFNKDGSINTFSQESYVAWMNNQPISAVALWAHTGRGLFISKEQREYIFRSYREGLSREKMILCGVGALANDKISDEEYMDKAYFMALHAKELGADMLLPYAPTLFRGREDQDEKIIKYHKKIAQLGVPMILFFLYEEAGGITYSKEVLKELFKIKNVIGIKMATLDSVMTYQDISNLILKDSPETYLITGEDRMFGYTVSRGAKGALVGLGSIYTKLQYEMMQAYYEGEYEKFIELSAAVDNLAENTFYKPMEGYIERVLYILARKNIISMEAVNDPYGPGISVEEKALIDECIEKLGDM
ncbi:hypothetical protein GCM10008905_00870 [Clostridium malenominatum]|uniref:4-hydroxy-tetrahydrodipicolinate synthase n=1 Tax=Clostridium malenominatum TaxID=1539 RepID=A0ABP3TTZ6_9CLOT